MMRALFPLFSRIRELPALVRKLFRIKPRSEEFAPQRVCPFCGLITERSKRYCLECGKFQTSLEVDSERTTKMPFSGDCHPFNSSTLKALNDIGSVYGLFKTDLPFHPDHYTCLFVGQTSDLRKGLLEHYDHPSITGVTHFFAEDGATEEQRKLRQKQLIAEFNPPGNKRTGSYTNLPFKGPIPTPQG
jgi:hypothetical protein